MKPAFAALIAVLALGLVACGAENDTPRPALRIEQAWVRAAPAPGSSAAYLRVVNEGDVPDRLLSVESPVAGSAQLHETVHSDGMMAMRHRPEGFAVPAHGALVLEPGGRHVMLHGLTRALSPGEHVTLVLHFEHAGAVPTEARVASGADAAH